MKYIIDIGHPGHVHLFKSFALDMQEMGHSVLFTCRQKEFEIELLKSANFDYVSFGEKYTSILGKIFGLLIFNMKLLKVALKFKPNLFLSAGSMYAAQVSFILHKPHITMEDTGNMEQIRLYKPFTNAILTSDIFHKNLGSKQIIYSGYHELAYLHPNVFNLNMNILSELDLKKEEKSILFRFVSWNASHDLGQGGFSNEEKIKIVENLASNYKVFISSESELPQELEKYRLQTEPEKIHDVLSCMSLFIGEGATMASECAMLATPAIYVNTMEAGTIDDQEKYGLVYHFRDASNVLSKANEILSKDNLKEEYIVKRNKMLEEKIDVSKFLVWFISQWPNSYNTLKKNPEFQKSFK